MTPGARVAHTLERAAPGAPAALLSNGRLHSLVTGRGTGGVFHGDDALTRWLADPVCDRDGYLLHFQDPDAGWMATIGFASGAGGRPRAAWSPGVFTIEQARDGIEVRLEVCVSPAEDVELRRVRLRNASGRERRIGVTSYLEAVLQKRAADLAHPAFSKLFVETAHRPAPGALVARRRPRAAGEKHPWLAHAVIGGEGLEFETDRARFVGRGHSRTRPAALTCHAPLSGTTGAVLDPILSWRAWCRLAPGEARSVCFLLAAGPDEDAVLGAIAQHATPEAIAAVFARAETLDRALLERLGLDTRAARARQHDWIERWMRGPDAMGLPGAEGEPGPFHLDAAAEHLPAVPEAEALAGEVEATPAAAPPGPVAPPVPALVSDNGIGGFAPAGDEYVIRLARRADGTLELPPAPWINVIANEGFGFLSSETGAGTSWRGNSRERRLTPWANDPLLDPHNEAHYLRDLSSGRFWSILPGPAPGASAYEVRHGFGYTTHRHVSGGLEHEVQLFVPRRDAVRVALLRLTNRGAETRRMTLVSYQELAPPAEEGGVAVGPGTIAVRRPARGDFGDSVAFAALFVPGPAGGRDSRTGDRRSFLGPGGDLASPAALVGEGPLDGAGGTAAEPCLALAADFEILPGATVECVLLLGEADDAVEAARLAERYRDPGAAAQALREARAFWQETLSGVRIETPSGVLDRAVNGWLAYQTMACRLWARSALYQSGGAFGFRDQLQDAEALILLSPERARAQLVLHAEHQLVEGDVLHWWHPPRSRGLRTRFADDLLWLPYLAAHYVRTTGDASVLDEEARFLTARPLAAGEDEALVQPRDAGERADLYQHCTRALDRSLAVGAHGLPLFGTGDWNDGMNRVGREGRGESVWMGFFLYAVLGDFLPLCERRGEAARAARYAAHREALAAALERHGWDGGWYLRGYFDDGSRLGSRQSDECRIDGLVQAWSVLSGAATRERAEQALDAVESELIREEDGMIRLLWPPFDRTPQDPGYVKGYLPGVRENGGQYTHAALWVVSALAQLGRHERAARLLEMLLPESHARTPEGVARYRLEPYAIAADVYGVAPHVGRGGWSWYTGSAGWAFRVAVESILGFRRVDGEWIEVRPCVPDAWPSYRLSWRVPGESTRYDIAVRRAGPGTRVTGAALDGEPLDVQSQAARAPIVHDGRTHTLTVTLGG